MSAWPWPSSDVTDKVIGAFVAALQSVEDVARNKKAEIELKTGGKLRYGYADLDAVLEAVKPVLTAHGLAVTQPPASDGVHAVMMHSSGEWLNFPALQVSAGQGTAQAQGSAISYARRYQMLGLLNIVAEDDDGKAASKPKAAATQTRPTPPAASDARPHRPAIAGKPTQKQLAMAGALFNGHGWTDRETRLTKTAELIGRPVDSWDELTPQEMSAMIDRLKADT